MTRLDEREGTRQDLLSTWLGTGSRVRYTMWVYQDGSLRASSLLGSAVKRHMGGAAELTCEPYPL